MSAVAVTASAAVTVVPSISLPAVRSAMPVALTPPLTMLPSVAVSVTFAPSAIVLAMSFSAVSVTSEADFAARPLIAWTSASMAPSAVHSPPLTFWTLAVVMAPAAVISTLFTFAKSFRVTSAPALIAALAISSPVRAT